MTVRAPDTTPLAGPPASEAAADRASVRPATDELLRAPQGAAARPTGDRVFAASLTLLALTVVGVPALMLLSLLWASRHAIVRFGPGFITSSRWDPVHEQFGAWPFVWGTVFSSILALCLAVPVSIGLAIFLSDLAPRPVRKPLGFVVELLAAIPSVVYGFWGIFVLVPFLRDDVQPFLGAHLGFLPLFRGEPLGFGMLAASIVLAIMIVPTITSISREVMQAVPGIHREAAIGLGATPWDVVRVAVLPAARSGIVGAVILGLNRALGETMAVTMVIGNRPKVSTSLFDPAYTMASVLANEFAEADSDAYLSALSEIALLLLGVAFVMNLLARWLVNVTKQRIRGDVAR